MTTPRITKKAKDAETIASLQAQLKALGALPQQPVVEIKEVEVEVKKDPNLEKIGLDEYINVKSLIPHVLNLTSIMDGSGPNRKFTKFGEVKRIMYKDLVEVMEIHPNFIQDGYCYILDPRVVRQHGLEDAYKKILTKEKMDMILEGSSDDCVVLYSSATAMQQDIIVGMLIEKLRDNPGSLDLNTLDKISRLSGVDIAKRAEEELELLKPQE